MSRAARETGRTPHLRSGDDLPPLRLSEFATREADPVPETGPVRDALAEQAAARAERAQTAMETAAQAWADRVAGVVAARLKGPRARKGTRYWESEKSAPRDLEFKAIDDEYVVPDSLINEIGDTMRPVALRVTADAGRDAFDRLTDMLPDSDEADDTGAFAIDHDLLADLIDESLEELLGTAERYAKGLREAITTGDSDGVGLDELLDRVGEAATRGGNWLRLNARTLGTALAARSALETARRLGVTHTQWISRRDPRVRPTHVIADGQVRPIGEAFHVGARLLEYPGDPTGLPETADEVRNCRCGLLFAAPRPEDARAMGDVVTSIGRGEDSPAATALVVAASSATLFSPVPDGLGLTGLASVVATPSPVVAYRTLAAVGTIVAGQQMLLPAGTVLGLAVPSIVDTATLAVSIPAGTTVGVSGGTLVLTGASTVEVLSVSAMGVAGLLQA